MGGKGLICTTIYPYKSNDPVILYKPIDKERLQKILRATQSTVERERRRTLAPGTRVQMNLHLSGGTKPIACLRPVARLTNSGQMGIHFERLEPRADDRLVEYLLPMIPEERWRG